MSISWPHHSMAIPRHSHGSMIAWRYHGNSATIACHQHDTLSRRNGSFYVLHHGLARKNAVHRPRTRARKKGILTQRSLYKNAVHPLRTRSNKIKSDAPRRQGSGSRGVGHVSARLLLPRLLVLIVVTLPSSRASLFWICCSASEKCAQD